MSLTKDSISNMVATRGTIPGARVESMSPPQEPGTSIGNYLGRVWQK